MFRRARLSVEYLLKVHSVEDKDESFQLHIDEVIICGQIITLYHFKVERSRMVDYPK